MIRFIRTLALAAFSAVVFVGVSVSPIAGSEASSSRMPPHHAGPDTDTSSPSQLDLSPQPRTQITTSAPYSVSCDGAFNTVVSPTPTTYSVLVSDAAVSANDVWAVGYSFDPASPTNDDRTLAEHWDGTSWTIVPTPNPGPYANDLADVTAISSNDVWAVGSYQVTASGDYFTFAEHWNGSVWSESLSTPNPSNQSFLFGVTALASDDVWAVGTWWAGTNGYVPLVAHWNGRFWDWKQTPTTTGGFTQLFAVSAWSPSDVWAVGSAKPVSDTRQSFAEHWNGSTWEIVNTANSSPGQGNEIIDVVALDAGRAEGVGYGNYVPGVRTRKSAAFGLSVGQTGTNTLLPIQGTGDNALIGVSRAGGHLWAGGYWRYAPTYPRQSLAVPGGWDATTHELVWGSQRTSANPSQLNNVFDGIAAVSPYAFWATGYKDSATGVHQTLTELFCGLHFSVSAPTTAAAGVPFNVSVTAKDQNNSTVTRDLGAIHFTSSDPSATLPSDYTFVEGDLGSHTFTVALKTLRNQTITVTSVLALYINGSAIIAVQCDGICPAPAGTPGSRSANPAPAGTPGSRSANPAPAGTPGPRGTSQGSSNQKPPDLVAGDNRLRTQGPRLPSDGVTGFPTGPLASGLLEPKSGDSVVTSAVTRGDSSRSFPSSSNSKLQPLSVALSNQVTQVQPVSDKRDNIEVVVAIGLLLLTLLPLGRLIWPLNSV